MGSFVLSFLENKALLLSYVSRGVYDSTQIQLAMSSIGYNFLNCTGHIYERLHSGKYIYFKFHSDLNTEFKTE